MQHIVSNCVFLYQRLGFHKAMQNHQRDLSPTRPLFILFIIYFFIFDTNHTAFPSVALNLHSSFSFPSAGFPYAHHRVHFFPTQPTLRSLPDEWHLHSLATAELSLKRIFSKELSHLPVVTPLKKKEAPPPLATINYQASHEYPILFMMECRQVLPCPDNHSCCELVTATSVSLSPPALWLLRSSCLLFRDAL